MWKDHAIVLLKRTFSTSKKAKIPWQRQTSSIFFKGDQIAVPPWFTAFAVHSVGTDIPRRLTHVTRCEILGSPPLFRTLNGPFAIQFPTRLSATRALCVVLKGFISASTVYMQSIAHPSFLVNSFWNFCRTRQNKRQSFLCFSIVCYGYFSPSLQTISLSAPKKCVKQGVHYESNRNR